MLFDVGDTISVSDIVGLGDTISVSVTLMLDKYVCTIQVCIRIRPLTCSSRASRREIRSLWTMWLED